MTMINKINTHKNSNVDRALISGLIPLRAMEKIKMDRLVTPEPVVKKLMMKSSKDKVKARIKPVSTPGMISGRITRRKA